MRKEGSKVWGNDSWSYSAEMTRHQLSSLTTHSLFSFFCLLPFSVHRPLQSHCNVISFLSLSSLVLSYHLCILPSCPSTSILFPPSVLPPSAKCHFVPPGLQLEIIWYRRWQRELLGWDHIRKVFSHAHTQSWACSVTATDSRATNVSSSALEI